MARRRVGRDTPEGLGQGELAVQAGPGRQLAGLDGLLQLLGDLVVHGHGAVSINADR